MGYRVVTGGILCNCRDNRAFGERQIGYVFVEITGGGGLNAEAALPQVDCVHVCLQNLFLVHLFFNPEGKILFLEFSFHPVIKCLLCYKIWKYVVFDQLLGNGAGAFGKIKAVCNAYHAGAKNTLKINAVMFIKTFVLNGYKSIRHVFRNIFISPVYTVGVGILECPYLCAVLVYDGSCIAFRHDIVCRYIRCVVYDLFRHDGDADNTDDCQKQDTQDKRLEKSDTDAFFLQSLLGRDLVLSL